jgi:pilus assembly protein Flp/PilA
MDHRWVVPDHEKSGTTQLPKNIGFFNPDVRSRGYMKKICDFIKGEEGATAVEYSIMLAAIAAVIILVVYSIGTKTSNAFNNLDTLFK